MKNRKNRKKGRVQKKTPLVISWLQYVHFRESEAQRMTDVRGQRAWGYQTTPRGNSWPPPLTFSYLRLFESWVLVTAIARIVRADVWGHRPPLWGSQGIGSEFHLEWRFGFTWRGRRRVGEQKGETARDEINCTCTILCKTAWGWQWWVKGGEKPTEAKDEWDYSGNWSQPGCNGNGV